MSPCETETRVELEFLCSNGGTQISVSVSPVAIGICFCLVDYDSVIALRVGDCISLSPNDHPFLLVGKGMASYLSLMKTHSLNVDSYYSINLAG